MSQIMLCVPCHRGLIASPEQLCTMGRQALCLAYHVLLQHCRAAALALTLLLVTMSAAEIFVAYSAFTGWPGVLHLWLQVLACALLQDLGEASDGVRCGELAAFCVDPGFRGSGRGDSLLDYVEQVWSAVVLDSAAHLC